MCWYPALAKPSAAVSEERLSVPMHGRTPKRGTVVYRDLRRYGTVPHAGFGLGFELVLYLTGMENIGTPFHFHACPIMRFKALSHYLG